MFHAVQRGEIANGKIRIITDATNQNAHRFCIIKNGRANFGDQVIAIVFDFAGNIGIVINHDDADAGGLLTVIFADLLIVGRIFEDI